MLHRKPDSFSGQLLIAMPGMSDPRFAKSVVFMCHHDPHGAMGIIINQPAGTLTLEHLLEQINMKGFEMNTDYPVHFGGPVESSRGFVLHSSDYTHEETQALTETIYLSSTLDVLRAIAEGHGPKHCLLALGYAGWSPGQLEQEMQTNGWLTAPANADLVFDKNNQTKWTRAMSQIGVQPAMLSGEAGHA
jgi:putative transcriptional regulator